MATKTVTSQYMFKILFVSRAIPKQIYKLGPITNTGVLRIYCL